MKPLSEIKKEWRRFQFLERNNLTDYVKDRMRDYINIAQLEAELEASKIECNRLYSVGQEIEEMRQQLEAENELLYFFIEEVGPFSIEYSEWVVRKFNALKGDDDDMA